MLGASGKTGRALRHALARTEAARVRPIGRAHWADLAGALRGCEAAYLIAPNLHADEPGFITEVLTAARAAGVRRVVYHSVAAPYAPAMPHHLGKAAAEDRVRRWGVRDGVSWTILQPCAYMQNFVPALRDPAPVLRVPYDVDAPFGLLDLADVAEAAATVLLDDAADSPHRGATYELGGPRLVSVRDVAEAASAVLGRDVVLEQIHSEAWRGGDDLDAREREWLRAMFASYDAHGLPTGPLPLTALLGRTPTDLAEVLSRELAGA